MADFESDIGKAKKATRLTKDPLKLHIVQTNRDVVTAKALRAISKKKSEFADKPGRMLSPLHRCDFAYAFA
jgi:hypothetical protein